MSRHRHGRRELGLAAMAAAALLLGAFLPGAASAEPPEGNTYRQVQSTTGSAGHTATGTTYVNRGTLGQPTPVGPSDGTDTYHEPGFWHAPEAAGDDDSGDDDSGDDDSGDDDMGSDDDVSDDDTSSDDDTGADDDDDAGRDVCACTQDQGPPPVRVGLLALIGLLALRRARR